MFVGPPTLGPNVVILESLDFNFCFCISQETSISRLRKSTVGDPRARRRVKRGKHCISKDFVTFLASMSTMPCMVSELTSSDQLTVWGRVVVERQVFADQARRPFSAILAKNLKQSFFRASNTALPPSQFFEAKNKLWNNLVIGERILTQLNGLK